MTAEYEALNFATARIVVKASILAKQPILLVGSPGVGKTALMSMIAKDLNMELWTVIASACDPTDFGGFPVVKSDGAFDRVPMRAIKEASERGVLVFFDEIGCVPKSVEGPMLRGIYEGWFGDTQLHEDSTIVAAMNPTEQTGLGDLSCTMIGRFNVYSFEPTIEEVREYFYNLGEDGSDLRRWANDFAATTERAGDLIQMHPTEECINEGAKWAAPRDWERGLNCLTQLPEGTSRPVVRTLLSGAVGKYAARSFLSILELRDHLPTVAEIVADPKGAKLPQDTKHQVAALGLLATVAGTDSWAAWIYADRLESQEIKIACARSLCKRAPCGAKKNRTEGLRAFARLNSQITSALGE